MNIKLHYLDVRARGESIKLFLKYVKQDFELDSFGFAEMKERNKESPNHKCPWVTIDGKELAEEFAILRFLSKKHGLYGKDDWDAAEIDMIADMFKDLIASTVPYLRIANGAIQGDLDTSKKEVLFPSFEKYLPSFINFVKNSGTGFLHSSGLSWADFVVANWITSYVNFDDEFKTKYPELIEYQTKVYDLPGVKEYVEERPHSFL
ncbi:hypothetical protein FO519_005346 [Halicephalobus sp. NKZ332]|nr:hypothetical protein FO519_005346 [Halicephalobus sp. NKZ332]